MMYFIIVIIPIMFIYVYITTINQRKNDKTNGIILRTINSQYLGGLNDIEGGKSVSCILYNNRLEIYFTPQNYKIINISNINNIGIKSEIQIQNDVTLGRLLAVGILAFGIKKQKTAVNNYVVVNYNDDNKEENIIINTNRNEDIVKNINNLI